MSEFHRFRSFLIPGGLTATMAYIGRPKLEKTRKNTCFQTPTPPNSCPNGINNIRRNRGARPKLLCPLASTNRGLAPKLRIAFYFAVHSRRQAPWNQEAARDSGRKGVFRKCRNSARCENGNVLWNQRKCGCSGSGGPRQVYESAIRWRFYRLAKPGALEGDRYKVLANGNPDPALQHGKDFKSDERATWPRSKESWSLPAASL
jgi:hypothetical protein